LSFGEIDVMLSFSENAWLLVTQLVVLGVIIVPVECCGTAGKGNGHLLHYPFKRAGVVCTHEESCTFYAKKSSRNEMLWYCNHDGVLTSAEGVLLQHEGIVWNSFDEGELALFLVLPTEAQSHVILFFVSVASMQWQHRYSVKFVVVGGGVEGQKNV